MKAVPRKKLWSCRYHCSDYRGLLIFFALTIPATLAESAPCDRYSVPFTMYVKTANGGTLNVRNVPGTADKSIIGRLDYGTAVTVLGVSKDDAAWVQIRYSKAKEGTAWVMVKFLSMDAPSAADIAQAEINHQMMYYKDVARFTVAARPSNPATGWVNLRNNPGMGADMIATLVDGQRLTVIGETLDWYKAVDSVTGLTGYVMKTFVARAR